MDAVHNAIEKGASGIEPAVAVIVVEMEGHWPWKS